MSENKKPNMPVQEEEEEERELAAQFYAALTRGLRTLTFKRIRFSELRVDHSYQRSEVSKEKFAQMAREFSPEAFGAELVGRRADGYCYIVDAQQRHCALRYMIAIVQRHYGTFDPLVPCLVFESEGAVHEAAVYFLINGRRTPLKPHENFTAAVLAGREPYVTIAKHLDSLKMDVGSPDSRSPQVVGFTGALVKTWLDNAKACREALKCQRKIISPSGVMVRALHKGLWYVISGSGQQIKRTLTSLDIERLRRKGKDAICDVISKFAGKGERAHTATCGEAILFILDNDAGGYTKARASAVAVATA